MTVDLYYNTSNSIDTTIKHDANLNISKDSNIQ